MKDVFVDVDDLDSMIALMDRADEFPDTLMGTNEYGENTLIEIASDCIKITTLQDNGWMRDNYYYPDGTVEEVYEHTRR